MLHAIIALLVGLLTPPTFAFNCEGLTCKFLLTDDVWTAAQQWDFGDGWCSLSPDPWYQYDQPGTYMVTLTTPQGSVTHPVAVAEPSQVTRAKGRR